MYQAIPPVTGDRYLPLLAIDIIQTNFDFKQITLYLRSEL